MLIAPHISSADELIAANLQSVRAEIAAAAAACGSTDFGESYLQEALPKIDALRELALTWHFIGRIQANKSAAIAQAFDWVHGVDRLKIAERLSAQRPHYAPPLQLCLQVNIAGESGKAGVAPAAAAELALAVRSLPHLKLRGVMCILPAGGSAADNRDSFQRLRLLLAQLNARLDARAGGLGGRL